MHKGGEEIGDGESLRRERLGSGGGDKAEVGGGVAVDGGGGVAVAVGVGVAGENGEGGLSVGAVVVGDVVEWDGGGDDVAGEWEGKVHLNLGRGRKWRW